jgi:transcription-repair coupling factor (superfamily II helicase)
MRRRSKTEEYLILEFAHGARLHVPATQIDLVQKYVGGFHGRPPLSLLGGKRWGKQKEQVAQAVRDLAAEMLSLQAARASLPGIRYPPDTAWQREFEAEFPYEETEDQLAALAEVKKDMTDGQPMDRLICGDVGFGKTEIAIRAAFKAVEFGKQVAVLVPTTVLAEQHERTFRERMADYPFRIESLSRFKTPAQTAQTLKDLAAGHIDIVIGTHRLLSDDVKFADLGLVIIDEEQRFGVEHKQKLMQLRVTVDALTLSATPIPRTLHMAMLGLRDISSLSTPPLSRRAIVTEVIPFDEDRIQQAIVRELNRDGQVYFVHNRVHDIRPVADRVQRLVPHARIAVGHGQMHGHELEGVMLRFIRRQVDVLVCTTIIESGIDIPTANTIFIDQADHFGLAELHQLRGRVGRYKHRAYCYLLLPTDRPITDTATRRLKAIEQYSMLGAGFKIAMRDLEIRGAGNLLGAEQSGHIATVGYEMYCRLLEQAARRLRHEHVVEPTHTHIDLPVSAYIPKRYIGSDKLRMEAYRRLSYPTCPAELDAATQDLIDAYGPLPPQATALIDLTAVRLAASRLGVLSIELDGPDMIFRARQPHKLQTLLAQAQGRVSLIDDSTVYYRPPSSYLESATLLPVIKRLFTRAAVLDEPRIPTPLPSSP